MTTDSKIIPAGFKKRPNIFYYIFRVAFVVLLVAVVYLLMNEEDDPCPPPVYTCPPMVATGGSIDELILTRTVEDIYSLRARTNGTSGSVIRSTNADITACKEVKFNFGTASTTDGLDFSLDNINFRGLQSHEMLAIGVNGSNITSGIKGFFSIKDTRYPPPYANTNINRTPSTGSAHDDFTKKFRIQTLSILRDPATQLYSLAATLSYTMAGAGDPPSYEFLSSSVLFDSIRNNYTIVLAVQPGNGGLQFPPRAMRLFDHATKYSGRPSGWPGVDPNTNPGCSDMDGNWNHTDGIAIVIVDKSLHRDAIDWNLITSKKALLCFK